MRNLFTSPSHKLLIYLSIFSFLLSIARVFYTGSLTYLFLNWNLFLAAVPWFISYRWDINRKTTYGKITAAGIAMCWIVFFPNAPYILTDLLHLRNIDQAPHWFDVLLIVSFAWTGLLFGFISLRKIETMLSGFLQERSRTWLVNLFLIFSALGVYMGRYLRWNSWDIITQPGNVLSDLSEHLLNPLSHPRTYGLTLLMGTMLILMYRSFLIPGMSQSAEKAV